MADRPMYRPVYKALHRPLTICGVDRRLFFLSLLLEGKTNEAEATINDLADSPAYFYAIAAAEVYHARPEKAREWIRSAREVYPTELCAAYDRPLVQMGWLGKNAAR